MLKPFLDYLSLSFLIGFVAVWASENFFWSAPPADLSAVSLLLTWVAYSLCVSAALSAVILTGIEGWKALFLGGAILGFLVEGVVVGTMYDAFPAQLVWTPLAWHALFTSSAVFGLCRAAVHWPVWKQVAGWLLVGLFGVTFAQYWPLEHKQMPGLEQTAAYIFGLGLFVPFANMAIDRLGMKTLPSNRWLLVTPALATLIWSAKLVIWFNPFMLSLPPLMALTVWIMKRLGKGRTNVNLGEPAPFWRHLIFLIAPAISVAGSVAGWSIIGGTETNIPVALATGMVGLGMYVWLVWRGVRGISQSRIDSFFSKGLHSYFSRTKSYL